MAHSGFSNVLKNGGFQAFLWTQFLGAFNDSVYQTIVALHVGNANPAYVPLVPAVFTLPSLLFSGYSGHLADLVSKRSVLIGVKALRNRHHALRPRHPDRRLDRRHAAGGLPDGTARHHLQPRQIRHRARDARRPRPLARQRAARNEHLRRDRAGHRRRRRPLRRLEGRRPGGSALATLAIAVIGFATSLRITRVPASGATQPFRWNPFGEIAGSTRHLLHDKPLWLAVLGVSYFWFAGVLLKTDLQYFGKDVLHADDNGVSLLWAFLAIGIGVGNMLAGRLSGDKVELGLVPLGAAFMGVLRARPGRRAPLLRALHRRRGLPGDGQRTLRGAALRLHPAAQRRARKGPRGRHQQLLPDHRHAASRAA